jgi:hypothetical protein
MNMLATNRSKDSPLTLNELEESDVGPVWVLNTTEGQRRAQVVIEIPNENGNGHTQVFIPMSWIPINLTDQVRRGQLLRGQNFRSAVAKKLIRLIRAEEAEKMLQQPGAAEEQQRISEFSINNPSEVAPQGDQQTENLSPVVLAIYGTMADNGEIEVMNTLRNIGALQEHEYRAIHRRAKQLGYRQLKELAKELNKQHNKAQTSEDDD